MVLPVVCTMNICRNPTLFVAHTILAFTSHQPGTRSTMIVGLPESQISVSSGVWYWAVSHGIDVWACG
jgi:hypothetical protein